MGLFDFFRSTPTQAQFARLILKTIASRGNTEILAYEPD